MVDQLKITVIATGFEGRRPSPSARGGSEPDRRGFEERLEERKREEEEKYEIPTFLRKK
jgi:hypothetical protein